MDALMTKHALDNVLPFEKVKVSPAALQANEIVPGLGIMRKPLDAQLGRAHAQRMMK